MWWRAILPMLVTTILLASAPPAQALEHCGEEVCEEADPIDPPIEPDEPPIAEEDPDNGDTVVIDTPSEDESLPPDDPVPEPDDDSNLDEDTDYSYFDFYPEDEPDLNPSTQQLIRESVENSPTDPVVGQPFALQPRMANASFVNGTNVGPSHRIGGSRALGTLANDHFGVGLSVGYYKGPGFSARFSGTPISYVMPLDDPRWAVKIDVPLTFSRINGVENFSASVGVGLRIPVYDHWTLTPEIRAGYTKNRDLDISARLFNASIISNYEIPLKNGYGVTIGNSLTYSTTFNSLYDYENVIAKNGVELSRTAQMRFFELPTNWEFSVVHTKVFGDPVYIDEWVDVSISLGTVGSKNNVTWDSFRVGLTYTKAKRGVEGLNINFGYEF